ncbi:barstar family protein [Kineosporia babensis]|uniref:Barstar family protein n=1 Tax=Kineosporia babensis TaxID=499548 RepID=A0A9X1ND41_9ACTN|nr:barstar family protein [Kineosporia babensis]
MGNQQDVWQQGIPQQRGLWTPYDSTQRRRWLAAALQHQHLTTGPDRPPGATFRLDGAHITDIEGFYCDLGEAVNGPGGYFGHNGDALNDCTLGGFGALAPFELVWPHAGVVRAALPGFEAVLRWLAESQVQVRLEDQDGQ